jgi:hypothetical protein
MKKLLTVLLSLFVLAVQAQESKNSEPKTTSDSALVMLTTNSGENFVGYIVSEDPREVTIRLIDSNKLLSIPTYTVKSIKPATKESVINGKVIYPNPHPSRYFYTPSALPMDKGEIYIQTVYFAAYQVQVGITDRFSLGATTTIVGTPLALTTKYSIPINEKNTLAVGGLAGFVGWGTQVSLGIGFGTYTYGTKESNITFGAGLGWIRDGDLDSSRYTQNGVISYPTYAETNSTGIFSIAGNKRISKNLSLMGEFWVVPSSGVVFGGPCLRLYNNKKSSFDFGIWGIGGLNEGITPLVPVFSYTFKFEK